MNWQPIATAPKDGTYILVYDASNLEQYHDEDIMIVFWHDCAEGLGSHKAIMAWCEKDSYNDEQGGWYEASYATHWMPLPDPPKEEIIGV